MELDPGVAKVIMLKHFGARTFGEIGAEMTEKGVRTEGRALGATGPIVW